MGKVRIKRSLLASALLLWFWGGSAQAEPLTVTWAELRADRPSSCSALLEYYLTQPNARSKRPLPGCSHASTKNARPGSADLDGTTVRIAGYAHPLEFQFKDVKEFLLIPPLRQECTHPPPPLPDQVISVQFPRRYGCERRSCLGHRRVAPRAGQDTPGNGKLHASGHISYTSNHTRSQPHQLRSIEQDSAAYHAVPSRGLTCNGLGSSPGRREVGAQAQPTLKAESIDLRRPGPEPGPVARTYPADRRRRLSQ
jgi:hypothetical protein